MFKNQCKMNDRSARLFAKHWNIKNSGNHARVVTDSYKLETGFEP